MLFTEIIAVYFINHMEQLKVLWRKKPEFCNFKAGSADSNHSVLQGQALSNFKSHFHLRPLISP